MLDAHVAWAVDVVGPDSMSRRTADLSRWIGGEIRGDPAYKDGIIYVGSPDGFVYAINTLDGGDLLWTFDAEDDVKGGITVNDDGSRLFFGTDGAFFSVNTDGGTEEWQCCKDNEIFEQLAENFTFAPILEGELVIAGSANGYIFAWDADDGRNRPAWVFPSSSRSGEDPAEELDNFDYTGVVLGEDLYIGNRDGSVYAVDVDNGQQENFARTLEHSEMPYWLEAECDQPLDMIPMDSDCRIQRISTQIGAHEDGLVFGNYARQLYLWPNPGVIKWVYDGVGRIEGDVAIEDNLIVFAEQGGTVVGIDTDRRLISRVEGQRRDRMRHEWKQSTEGDEDVVTGPIIAAGVAYWVDRQGWLYAYRADTGREWFRLQVWDGECRRCTARPIVVDDMIYVATADGFLKAVRLPDR